MRQRQLPSRSERDRARAHKQAERRMVAAMALCLLIAHAGASAQDVKQAADSKARATSSKTNRDAKPEEADPKPVALGETVEITLRDNPQLDDSLIDFETGRLFSIPKKYREGSMSPPPLFEEWIVPNGIDALAETKRAVQGLIGFDMVVIPIDGPTDRLPDVAENRLSSQFVFAIPGRPIPISGKGDLPATYLFQSREGTRGVLQIVDFTDLPRGVTIRYKLLARKNSGLEGGDR